jgi:hypothetical protein
MQELIAKAIRLVILGALFYYIIIEKANNQKDLTVSVELANEIGADVVNVHDEKSQLADLGFTTSPRLVFDRNRIYPVILGMNMFKLLKLKEFDHFAFQHGDYLVQMAYV